MKKLFSDEEIVSSSVSGKTAAKPKFEVQKLDLVRKICLDLHGNSNITDKIQAVKKSVKREQMNNKSMPKGSGSTRLIYFLKFCICSFIKIPLKTVSSRGSGKDFARFVSKEV